MEHINIISKEPVMESPLWQGLAVLAICIFIMVCFCIYGFGRYYKEGNLLSYKWMVVMTICTISFEIISLWICDKYFNKVPTGTYKYEATIDKDKITVQQYEEFIEKYKPDIINGVYYWEE